MCVCVSVCARTYDFRVLWYFMTEPKSFVIPFFIDFCRAVLVEGEELASVRTVAAALCV